MCVRVSELHVCASESLSVTVWCVCVCVCVCVLVCMGEPHPLVITAGFLYIWSSNLLFLAIVAIFEVFCFSFMLQNGVFLALNPT